MTEMSAKTRNAALLRLLGKKVAWRVDDGALVGVTRQQAIDDHRLAREKRDAARKAREARAEYLLKNDPTYQALVAETKEAEAQQLKLQRSAFSRRITVGTPSGIGLLVEAEADSWDEAISIIEARQAPKKASA